MKRIKFEKGMSLVEVIVALAILSIVFTGMMGFFTDSFKMQKRSQDAVKAQKAAESILEQIKVGNIDLDSIDNSVGINKNNFTDIIDPLTKAFKIPSGKSSIGDESMGLKVEWKKIDEMTKPNGDVLSTLYEITITVYNKKDSSIKGTVKGSVTL